MHHLLGLGHRVAATGRGGRGGLGLKNTPGNLYSMTKFAVTGLAENVRMLTTRYGVGTTLIAPGRVLTPFWDERPGGGRSDDLRRGAWWTRSSGRSRSRAAWT
ncbi:hypothetical protein OG242_30290 [Streptomyces sp. NBC_00727]